MCSETLWSLTVLTHLSIAPKIFNDHDLVLPARQELLRSIRKHLLRGTVTYAIAHGTPKQTCLSIRSYADVLSEPPRQRNGRRRRPTIGNTRNEHDTPLISSYPEAAPNQKERRRIRQMEARQRKRAAARTQE